MNLKKYLPLGLATMLIFGSVVLATSANEGKGGLMKGFRGQNPAIITALDSADYDAWVKAVSVKGEVPEFLKVVTKDNFAKFVEMHKLMKEGKKDEAKAIADELGLKLGGKGPQGPGPMPGPMMSEAALAAIEAGDYNAWVKAVNVNGKMPAFLKAVTQDNFAKFVEAMKLQKQGMNLIQQSHEILKSIGVNPPAPGFKKGEGRERRGERFGQEATETNSEE